MIKRCVEVSSGPARLSIKDAQLVIKNESAEATVPVEDMGLLVLDHPAITYSHAALGALLDNNVAVIVCGGNRHPAGMLLPFEANTVQAETISMQAAVTDRTKARIWKELVSTKITNQANALEHTGGNGEALKAMAGRVKPGDPQNLEGQAAKIYWGRLFGAEFRRGRDEGPPNGLLNYGYTVLRAAVARAICGAGLHPSLGVHHRNRYNSFALADDLIEPLRPFVDLRVHALWKEGLFLMNRDVKAALLEVLSSNVELEGKSYPLMVSLHTTAASLKRALSGEGGLVLPLLKP